MHSVALARKPRALWPLRRGVIVEPDRSAAASASFASEASASGMIDPQAAHASEPAPLLVLERPLDEPQVIDDSAVQGALGCTILLSDALVHGAAIRAATMLMRWRRVTRRTRGVWRQRMRAYAFASRKLVRLIRAEAEACGPSTPPPAVVLN